MISRSQAALFREILARDYEVITNGYDPEDYTLEKPVVPDLRFSIAHIGSLVPSRNPVVLWKALEELCSESADFSDSLEIKLVGKTDYSVIESLKAHHLLQKLNKIDYLPHKEVVKIQYEARVLLLLINNTPNAYPFLTGKFLNTLQAKAHSVHWTYRGRRSSDPQRDQGRLYRWL